MEAVAGDQLGEIISLPLASQGQSVAVTIENVRAASCSIGSSRVPERNLRYFAISMVVD